MPDRPLLGLVDLPKPVPLKTGLRGAVDACVQRCQERFPILGQGNPDAVFVIERNINDLMPSSCDGVDPDQIIWRHIHLVVDGDPSGETWERLDGQPDLDQALLDEVPPEWWWSDPDWITRELAVVNDLLAIKRLKAIRHRRETRLLVRRHA